MNYEAAQALSNSQFKRRFGVLQPNFNRMVKGLKTQLPQLPHPGHPPSLSIENQILVALEYWREYPTYFHITTDRGVSESTTQMAEDNDNSGNGDRLKHQVSHGQASIAEHSRSVRPRSLVGRNSSARWLLPNP